MKIGILTKKSVQNEFLRAINRVAGPSSEFVLVPDDCVLRDTNPGLSAVLCLQYDRIIDRPTIEVLEERRIPLINLHFSLLPKYRGMHTIANALLRGEADAGITFHLIDSGIDTGPIVLQYRFPVHDFDTAERLYGRCMETFEQRILEIVRLIDHGTVFDNLTVQDNRQATYFDRHSINYAQDRVLTCRDATVQIWNRFRAFYFPRFQRPALRWRDRLIEIDELVPIFENGSRTVGHLCGIGTHGVRLDTLDGAIEIAAIIENGERISDARRILEVFETAGSTFAG